MISAILSCIALATPFSLGHINKYGTMQHATKVYETTPRVDISLPPRSAYSDLSNHRFFTVTRVQVVNGPTLRKQWHDDYFSYGRVASFNGDTIANFSYTRWINVYGYIS